MNIVERAKNILLTPKTEWETIEKEDGDPQSLLVKYVIPMILIGTVASFFGHYHIWESVKYGLAAAVSTLATGIISYYVSIYVIDALAPSFESEKNINQSAKLVAFSSTAAWLAGIFNIVPRLAFLGIVGLYSIYLFYLGLGPLKKTHEDKKVIYMIVAAIVMFVVMFVTMTILGMVIYGIIGKPDDEIVKDTLEKVFRAQ
jgi:hypothetical protein